MRKHFKSNSIEIKFTGGDASAGNGANGYNSGNITNTATMTINPYNKAEGGDVHTNTGDQVDQKAGWDPTTQTANSELIRATIPLATWMPAHRPLRQT